MSNNHRRRTIMLAFAALPVAALGTARASEKAGMVSETDDLAVQLGYKADATQVDATKFAKRAGPEGAKQFCSTCQFYEKPDSEDAPCVVFGGKKVSGKGWCNSWFARV